MFYEIVLYFKEIVITRFSGQKIFHGINFYAATIMRNTNNLLIIIMLCFILQETSFKQLSRQKVPVKVLYFSLNLNVDT